MTGAESAAGALLLLGILLSVGAPVGAALALASVLGIFLVTGNPHAAGGLTWSVGYTYTNAFDLIVLPLFMLIGEFANRTGIVHGLYDAAHKTVGHLPGGLAVATIFTSAGFSAMTGSSSSTAIVMTRIALPQMRRFGYDESFSVGVIASSGTFAMMIPPSAMLVIYAVLAQQSIGAMLLAGILPGLLSVAAFSTLALLQAHLNPAIAPPGPWYPWRERVRAIAGVVPFLLVVGGTIGAILFGLLTPTESAAVGSFVLLIYVIVVGGRFRDILAASRDSMLAGGSIFMIVIGSLLFSKFLALSGLLTGTTHALVSLNLPSVAMFALLVAFYLVLGCFLEGISMMALSLPVVLPVASQLGWDPIWLGIVIVMLIEIAQITPPVGLALFAVKSAAPEVAFGTIVRGVFPFILRDIGILILLYIFPGIPLLLPNIMAG